MVEGQIQPSIINVLHGTEEILVLSVVLVSSINDKLAIPQACSLHIYTNASNLSSAIASTAMYCCNASTSAARPHISPNSVSTSPQQAPVSDRDPETQPAIPESPSRSTSL